MKRNQVTIEQIEDLTQIFGYDFNLILPTVDEIIDYFREKYQIIIYHKAPPFVDPRNMRITYCFAIKRCSLRDGWNGRIRIGQTEWGYDIYQLKREAISIVLNYLKNQKNDKN